MRAEPALAGSRLLPWLPLETCLSCPLCLLRCSVTDERACAGNPKACDWEACAVPQCVDLPFCNPAEVLTLGRPPAPVTPREWNETQSAFAANRAYVRPFPPNTAAVSCIPTLTTRHQPSRLSVALDCCTSLLYKPPQRRLTQTTVAAVSLMEVAAPTGSCGRPWSMEATFHRGNSREALVATASPDQQTAQLLATKADISTHHVLTTTQTTSSGSESSIVPLMDLAVDRAQKLSWPVLCRPVSHPTTELPNRTAGWTDSRSR